MGKTELYTAPPASEREQIRRDHAEWSDKTFGDVGPIGPLKHLSKEALEAAADPSEPKDGEPRQHIKELSGPVVPDEIEPDSNNTYDYVDGWNACRAAMFQSKYRDLSQPTDPQVAEYEKIMLQAGNSPENSDG
ncbi:DUF550 domain-containing protein [Salmonella enterica]|nr:DUF550 domain-containing protein [Salmonella enterica]